MTDRVERFRATIADQLGLAFDDGKLHMLGDVLARRARGHRDEAAYLAQVGPAELAALAEELTVGETYFFRNPDQFAAFSELVVPARRRARTAGQPLRILSAACSTGEEPYSIAIALAGALEPAVVRAVDVNPTAIRRAQRGRYTSWALRETPPDVQHAWFRPHGRELVLDERIRAAVHFERRNLVADDPELWQPASYDVVFCRNVLMYFTPGVARRVIARIERSLVPGGYLFLGHAETLRGLSDGFHLCHTHGTFYYQRRETLAIARDPGPAPAVPAFAPERAPEPAPEPAPVPGAPRAPLAEVLALLQEERFAAALDVLDALAPGEPSERDRLLVRSAILAHSGRFAEAEAACRLIHAIDELDAGAHHVLALCRDGAGDRASAVEHDHAAAYLDPMFAMPRLHLGLLARRAGDRETANRELTQALLLLPHEDTARLVLFGGGFTRDALIALCRAELARMGGGASR